MRIVRLNKASRKDLLDRLLKRSPNNYDQYNDTVLEIVNRVRTEGDKALFEYTNRFDCEDIHASNILVTEEGYRKPMGRLTNGFWKRSGRL